MNTINNFFNDLAAKIPFDFIQGNFTVLGIEFSKLFIAAAALLLLILIIIIVSVSVTKSKNKKNKTKTNIKEAAKTETADINSPLSESPVKVKPLTNETLQKAVTTPTYEFEMPPEDDLTTAEQIVDINQVIIDEMDEKDKAVMLDEFDFDIEIDALCDFDTDLEDSEDDLDDETEENEESVIDDSVIDDIEENLTKKSNTAPKIRYERSFQAKLIKTTSNNKARYNVIKNMLVNYNKIRDSISWNCESFISGKNLIARMYLIGKTFRICLALNPADYDENIYHHEDKGATSKYKTVPMMIKIKSRLGLKRAVSLIMDLAEKFELEKASKLKIVDYIAANPYQNDDELLSRGLIRPENPNRYKIKTEKATKKPQTTEKANPDTINIDEQAAKTIEKPKPIKTETAKQTNKAVSAQIAADDATEKHSGKYVFVKKADGIHFVLIANNGQLLLESISGYTTPAGAKRGIETFKKAVTEGEFLVDDDKFGRFKFILKSKNSLATYTGETYNTKSAAESSANSVKRFALTAAIIPYEEEE